MGDFFYYGQKDVIRRLNELAGRGAVVASYAPAVGRSPLGGPNGYMDPAWLDSSKPIRSQLPISAGAGMNNKFGYNFLQGGQEQRLFKIATMLPIGDSTYSSLRIDAIIGGWDGYSLTPMTIVIGSRVNTAAEGIFVDWSSSRLIPTTVRFTAYLEADGTVSIYLYFPAGSFAQASFQLMAFQATTYVSPVAVSSVTGTLVWDSAASPSSPSYRSPRSRGMGDAPTALQGTSFDSIVEVRAQGGQSNASSALYGGGGTNATSAGVAVAALVHGISGNSGINYEGRMSWNVSAGNYSNPFTQGRYTSR